MQNRGREEYGYIEGTGFPGELFRLADKIESGKIFGTIFLSVWHAAGKGGFSPRGKICQNYWRKKCENLFRRNPLFFWPPEVVRIFFM